MQHLDVLQTIQTPAVVVDSERLSHNLARVQKIAEENGLRLRPHIKTHKCIELARMQLDYGACGITAAKASEALVFIESGVSSVTVAYPVIDPCKARTLVKVAVASKCELRFIADNERTLEALGQAAAESDNAIGVFIKIDVGLGRVGLKPHAEELSSMAHAIAKTPKLEFRGLLSHAGQCYAANGRKEVRKIAESERRQLLMSQDRIQQSGLQVPELSVGSTPTVLAAENFEGLSEIRPGNYVFCDLTAVRLGVATLAEVALSVVTSVVSMNETYAIIDAGSKVLSSDLGPHGSSGVRGFGKAVPLELEIDNGASSSALSVERLSEEHGFVRHGGVDIRVGDRLRVVPNHSCPVVNLADYLWIMNQDRTTNRWKVAAAGRVI